MKLGKNRAKKLGILTPISPYFRQFDHLNFNYYNYYNIRWSNCKPFFR